jgi:hypothetical protein
VVTGAGRRRCFSTRGAVEGGSSLVLAFRVDFQGSYGREFEAQYVYYTIFDSIIEEGQ